ncbi:MAG: helix-turn-helix transcriptional regulator [bacterium]|nr:helix-turn-helix transcriptional regulator [bacterium]
MKTSTWFTQTLEALKDDVEFRLESKILEITEVICQKMAEKKMTRTRLAEKLDISPPGVTKILNGNSNFTLKTLLSLSEALDQELVIEFKERNVITYHPIEDVVNMTSVPEEANVVYLNKISSLTSDTPIPSIFDHVAPVWEESHSKLSMEAH